MLIRHPAVPATSDVDSHLAELAHRGEFNVYLLAMPRPMKARFVPDNLLLASPESRRAAAAVEQWIREAQNLCQKHGSKLLLVLVPDSNQINRSQFDYYRRAGLALDERTLTTDVPQLRLRAVANSMKVPVLDMLPQFRARGSLGLYREYDPHFSAAGNGVAAELIMQELLKMLPQAM
jgi:hypothetical protein